MFFCRPTYADVADRSRHQDAFGAFQRTQHKLDGKLAAVLPTGNKFDASPDLLRQCFCGAARAIRHQPLGKTLRNDVLHLLAHQFIAVVAELLFCLHVQQHDFAALVDHHHRVRRSFQQTAVLRARLFALADVRVGAEPTHYFALRIADGNSLREEQAVGAVLAAQRKCIFPVLALLETARDLVHDALQVVRVMRFPPAPAGHLLHRGAGVFKPAIVVPEDAALLVCHPGELRHVIRQIAETLFAFAQRCFRLLARRVVALDGPTSGGCDQQAQHGSDN